MHVSLLQQPSGESESLKSCCTAHEQIRRKPGSSRCCSPGWPTASPRSRVLTHILIPDRFYRKVNEDNLALMRLDIEALVESAAMDCEIWVAKAADDGEIGSAAIFVPAGKSVGGT